MRFFLRHGAFKMIFLNCKCVFKSTTLFTHQKRKINNFLPKNTFSHETAQQTSMKLCSSEGRNE